VCVSFLLFPYVYLLTIDIKGKSNDLHQGEV